MNWSESLIEQIINVGFNGGAFGVLVIIAVWLMKNLPKWFSAHLETVKDIASINAQTIERNADRYAKELQAERDQCQKHNDRVIMQLESSNATTLKAFEAVGQRIADHHNFAVQQMANLQRREP